MMTGMIHNKTDSKATVCLRQWFEQARNVQWKTRYISAAVKMLHAMGIHVKNGNRMRVHGNKKSL